jgi:PAS domain S-box-containing protein
MRVLYVEDDARDATLVRHELARDAPGIALEVASTVAAARERLTADPSFDVALVDLRLPDGDGFELLREIRGRNLPTAVVIVTGEGDEATAVAALKAGADDYVSKQSGFAARLPATLEAARARFRVEAERRTHVLRVLYAEHHAVDVDLTRRHLAAHAPHIHLEVVHGAHEVLGRLPATDGDPSPCDVLLLDYRLPGESALELLKTLRDQRRLTLPVVLVTGQGDEEVAAQALRLGAADYLIKHPGYLFELPVALENAHHRARLAREQAALRESRERLQGVVESAMDAILSVDEGQRIVIFNAAAERMFRCPREQALGQSVERFLPERFRAAHRGQVDRFAGSGETRRAMGRAGLVRGLRLDGEEFPAEASISRASVDGAPLLTVILRDVTERLQADEELREARERLRMAVDAGNVGLWDWDLTSDRVRYSDVWKRQIGYAADEIADRFEEWRGRVHPDDLPRVLEAIQRSVATLEPAHRAEFRFRHRDGSYRHILSFGSVIADTEGHAVRMVGSHIDISDRVALEAQLRHAQKIESLGRLAGGVAHDFNNLLTVINNYAELAAAELAPDHKAREMLREIGAAGARAATLTRQLLTFSRRRTGELSRLNVDTILSGMARMLRRLLGEDVVLRVEPGCRDGRVLGEESQIEQVIMNLVVNARDAMPSGGELLLATAERQLDSDLRDGSVPRGSYVVLTVRDTGVGMDRATLDRIFEPFFTTKEQGRGTGLGLAMIHGIARQSGGYVRVESQPGRGTTFEMFLPRVAGDEPVARTPEPTGVARGEGVVLLVEDEPSVRTLECRILEAAGYQVMSAASGESAILLLENEGRDLDLLVTDVVMPGMSGIELAARLRLRFPRLNVLYTSGYSVELMGPSGNLGERDSFVGKPFTPAELTRKVDEALRRPR